MRYDSEILINGREISISSPTYFIADLAANHDGNLNRAKELIFLAKEAGADAVKFQHFLAKKIVSDYGFKELGGQQSHQSKWKKSVYEIYKQYECDRKWTTELVKTAKTAKIDFLTSPYDFDAIEKLNKYLPAYKIGSGDITWTEILKVIAKKGKPVILGTGASAMSDVERAVDTILAYNRQLILLQCNTNYTGSSQNFKYINIRVLQAFSIRYPHMILGLSDHTPYHATVLGAITMGARVIEKHFTDDTSREGPDHPFSMTPKSWKEMIERSRELELSLGSGIKVVEENELETVVLQRRCLRLKKAKKAGQQIRISDLVALRPAPFGSLYPYQIQDCIGKILIRNKEKGDAIYWEDFKNK